MKLTNLELPVDHVAAACQAIDSDYQGLLEHVATVLTTSIGRINKSEKFTPAEFWARTGTDGVNLLTALGTWRGLLEKLAPSLVNDTIAGAGSTLKVAADGTVSVP
jgi:hypothetical protein